MSRTRKSIKPLFYLPAQTETFAYSISEAKNQSWVGIRFQTWPVWQSMNQQMSLHGMSFTPHNLFELRHYNFFRVTLSAVLKAVSQFMERTVANSIKSRVKVLWEQRSQQLIACRFTSIRLAWHAASLITQWPFFPFDKRNKFIRILIFCE